MMCCSFGANLGENVSLRLAPFLSLFLGLASMLTLAACGGSSSGSSQPPSPSFVLAATPSSLTTAIGTSSTVQVSATSQNGFSGAVAVVVSGLPSGLSATPASFSLQSSPQTVTLTADSSLASGSYSIAFKGTSGSSNNSLTLSVMAGPLLSFVIVQPASSQVVTTFGGMTETKLQTQASGLGVANYHVSFAATGLPAGVSASFSPNP